MRWVELDKLAGRSGYPFAVSANKDVRIKHQNSLALPAIAADPSQINQVVLTLHQPRFKQSWTEVKLDINTLFHF